MATGMFQTPAPGNVGRTVARKREHRTAPTQLGVRKLTRLDQFAELLSRGMTPVEAARRMGLKPQSGYNMLNRIKQRLGWQAQ